MQQYNPICYMSEYHTYYTSIIYKCSKVCHSPPPLHTHTSLRKWHRFHLVDHCWPESTNHCLLHLDVDDDDGDDDSNVDHGYDDGNVDDDDEDGNNDDDDEDGNDDDNDYFTCPYNVFSSATNSQLSCCACQ